MNPNTTQPGQRPLTRKAIASRLSEDKAFAHYGAWDFREEFDPIDPGECFGFDSSPTPIERSDRLVPTSLGTQVRRGTASDLPEDFGIVRQRHEFLCSVCFLIKNAHTSLDHQVNGNPVCKDCS